MTSPHALDNLPLWAVFILMLIGLGVAGAVGYRLNKAVERRRPDKAEASVGALSGGALALLAFLLALVTSISAGTFTARRQAVVDEANAIGTTYLRAGYLPEPFATASRQLLREYVDLRLEALDRNKTAEAIARSEEIHGELWARAETLAKASSSPTLALYIAALNEVIDLHTDRINVELVQRLPWALLLGLFLMAVLAMGILGLHAGYAERWNPVAFSAFVLTLAVVFVLIMDLNRGQSGLFSVSQQALIDLQRQLNLPNE